MAPIPWEEQSQQIVQEMLKQKLWTVTEGEKDTETLETIKSLLLCGSHKTFDPVKNAQCGYQTVIWHAIHKQYPFRTLILSYLKKTGFRLQHLHRADRDIIKHTRLSEKQSLLLAYILNDIFVEALEGDDPELRHQVLNLYKKCVPRSYQAVKRFKRLTAADIMTGTSPEFTFSSEATIMIDIVLLMGNEVSDDAKEWSEGYTSMLRRMIKHNRETEDLSEDQDFQALYDRFQEEGFTQENDTQNAKIHKKLLKIETAIHNTELPKAESIYLETCDNADAVLDKIPDIMIQEEHAVAKAMMRQYGIKSPTRREECMMADLIHAHLRLKMAETADDKENGLWFFASDLDTEPAKEEKKEEKTRKIIHQYSPKQEELDQIRAENDALKQRLKEMEEELNRKQKELDTQARKTDELKKELQKAEQNQESQKELQKKEAELKLLQDTLAVIKPEPKAMNTGVTLPDISEEEFFPGETEDIVYDVLRKAVSSMQQSRRKDLITRLLEKSDNQNVAKRSAIVKRVLKDGEPLTATKIQALRSLGIKVELADGGHYKLNYHGADRYLAIVAASPSDRRSGKNNAATIINLMF